MSDIKKMRKELDEIITKNNYDLTNESVIRFALEAEEKIKKIKGYGS